VSGALEKARRAYPRDSLTVDSMATEGKQSDPAYMIVTDGEAYR